MRAFITIALGLLCGLSIGKFTGHRAAARLDDHFGSLTDSNTIRVEKTDESSNDAVVTDKGRVEIVGEMADFDFGVMHRETQGEHQFQLKNVGTGPLDVRVTGSTCKCTVGELKVNVIQPGEVADVNLTWTARSLGRQFAQTATVATSDPEKPEIKLSIHGTLVDSLALEPNEWDAGKITSGEPFDLKSTLYNYSQGDVEIESAKFLEDEIQNLATIDWETRKTSDQLDGVHAGAKAAIDFHVRVANGLKQGAINQTFRIRYRSSDDSVKEGTFDVNLRGSVIGPLRLVASKQLFSGGDGGGYRYDLGTVKQGSGQEEIVRLIVRGEEYKDFPIEITQVQPENVFDVTMGKEIGKPNFRMIPIVIRVKPDAPLGKYKGHLSATQAFTVIEARGSKLSPLKLWLTVDVIASGK